MFKILCDKNPCKRIAKSLHVSWTSHEPIANPSQTHRKSVSAIHTMRQLYKTNANRWDINKTISQRDCNKIKLSDIHTTVVRNLHECRETLARISHDCRSSIVNIIGYMSWSQCPVRLQYEIVENLCLYRRTLSPASREYITSQWYTSLR